MKKILFTILTVAILTTSYAQVNFGVRGGLNLSDYSNLNSDKKTDLYFGVLLSVKLGDLYTLQPEFTYSKEGTKLKGNYNRINSNTINADFFSVSVINKFNIANKVHVAFGPYFDIRMDESVDYNSNNNNYYYDAATNAVDIGFIVGMGFDVTKSLTLDARFKYGFIDTFNVERLDSNNQYDTYSPHKNQVIQLGISYKFNLKK